MDIAFIRQKSYYSFSYCPVLFWLLSAFSLVLHIFTNENELRKTLRGNCGTRSAMTWIRITSKLEQGLKIVAHVDNSKFRLLVNRICQSLQSSNDTKIFNEEEEEKLLVSLDLAKDELTLLLDTVTSIYMQAACNFVKPSVMESVMKDSFKIDEEKISIFINTWMTYGKGIVENFRQKSSFPTQVKDINWCLNVQSSSSAIYKEARPIALLQLDLTGDKTSTLTVEFEEKQLTDVYYNLEKIQSQLDALK